MPVREAIESWEPAGFFSRSSITLKELSYLLWCTQGFRKIVAETFQLRNVPSSGSRYPLETYFVASDVEGLEPGCTGISQGQTASLPNGSILT